MREKKVREIRVDIQEIILTRRVRRMLYAECAACGQRVQFVRAEQAAATCNTSTRTIYQWIESGQAHFIETRERLMFVCLDSLRVED
jgi:ribosomal protein L13